jgi:hypothetical protein
MELQAALLCEAASTRDGLLFVLGGGVDHWAPPAYPAGLRLTLGVVVEADDRDQGSEHAFAVDVLDQEAERIVGVTAGFQFEGQLDPGQTTKLAFAVPLEGVLIPEYGDYEVRLLVDGDTLAATALRAMAV